MGVVCTSHHTPIESDLVCLSSQHYKKFPLTERKAIGEVVMQLTGEGFSGNYSILHGNEMVTIRYHYQYSCRFATQDDSLLIYGAVVEPNSIFDQNPHFSARLHKWHLSNSPSTSVTRICTITSGPWSISPNGKLLSCLATQRYPDHVEDLYLTRCDPYPMVCMPCNVVGRPPEYRRMYPQECPFSPDGCVVASIRDIKGVLSIVITSATTAKVLDLTALSKSCKGLRGIAVSCQFSPDSQFLAVTSSFGQVYILKRCRLELYQKIEAEEVVFLDGVAPDLPPSEAATLLTPCTFDFDPRYPHHEFATCSFFTGLLRFWRVNSDQKNDVHCKQSLAFKKPLNIIKYSPDGTLLAIGDHESSISFVDPDGGAILFVLKTCEQQAEFRSQAGVFHIAFSWSGEHVAASYSDAFIRVWQLPAKFDLQHLCRLVINTCVSPRHAHQLPLPWSLKKYLLFENF